MKRIFLAIMLLLLIAPAMAQYVGGGGGGGSSSAGLYQRPTVLPNAAAGTTLNLLAEPVYTYGPSTIKATTMLSTTAGHTRSLGVVMAGAGTTGSATIVNNGPAQLIFDGTTVNNDAFTFSSTTNAQGHDTGITCGTSPSSTPPATATEFLGCVTGVNSGAGTISPVSMMLSNPAPTSNSCKCVPAGDVSCTTSAYTTFCSCAVQLPFDAGSGNAQIYTYGGKLALQFVTSVPTSIDFQMQAACPTNNTDPHGLSPSGQVPYAVGFYYNENLPVMALTFAGGANPLATACTVNLQCKAGGTAFTVKAPTADANGVPVGTGAFIMAVPWAEY